jgi:hypothetical protein
MKLHPVVSVLLLALLFSAAATLEGREAEGENPLSPLGWLVGGRWVAEVTPPEGEPFFREAQYKWTANQRMIRFESLIRRPDGSVTPY